MLLAASAVLSDGKSMLVLWDVQTGKVLRQVAGIDSAINVITINRDANLLAAGDERGRITLWPLQQGPAITLPPVGQLSIHSLAIHRFPSSGLTRGAERGEAAVLGGNEKQTWLLAAGDAGGGVTIWDLERRIPTSCRGSPHHVYTLAFSPDGTTLASAGRNFIKFWDVATGRHLLDMVIGDYYTGLAFSPDGKKLAASRISAHGPLGGVTVFNVEDGRGIQSLRGLAGPVAKVHFSPGGRYLAALSHNWQVGIWEVNKGSLLGMLNVRGLWVDNAAMAFDPPSKRLAFSAGTEARLWDFATGEVTTVELPPGLQDALAFDAAGKRLMLCRMETEGGKLPVVGTDFVKYPRVCRVRDLLAKDPTREVGKVAKLHKQDRFILAGADASYFLVFGGERTLILAGFSAQTLDTLPNGVVALDPTGKRMLLRHGGDKTALLEMPSAKLLEFWEGGANALSPGGRFWALTRGEAYGFVFGRRGNRVPHVSLGIDSQVLHGDFSDDGRLLAWGNANGTVNICNVHEVQHKLVEVGLGWE
jgi:WD40 repeat protein